MVALEVEDPINRTNDIEIEIDIVIEIEVEIEVETEVEVEVDIKIDGDTAAPELPPREVEHPDWRQYYYYHYY